MVGIYKLECFYYITCKLNLPGMLEKKFKSKLHIELKSCTPSSSSKFSKAIENLDACFKSHMIKVPEKASLTSKL